MINPGSGCLVRHLACWGYVLFLRSCWCLGRYWRHPSSAASWFLSLLLYYPPACMEAQVAVPVESTFSSCYLGIYDSLLTWREQEKLVILEGNNLMRDFFWYLSQPENSVSTYRAEVKAKSPPLMRWVKLEWGCSCPHDKLSPFQTRGIPVLKAGCLPHCRRSKTATNRL